MMQKRWVRAVAVLFCVGLAWLSPVSAEEPSSTLIGRQTIGMVIGGMLPVHVLESQSSKLNGVAAHPSWQITLTDPIGNQWWSGSIAVCVEVVFLGITQPTGAYGIGVTP
jgi:lipid A 3-O-deacylase